MKYSICIVLFAIFFSTHSFAARSSSSQLSSIKRAHQSADTQARKAKKKQGLHQKKYIKKKQRHSKYLNISHNIALALLGVSVAVVLAGLMGVAWSALWPVLLAISGASALNLLGHLLAGFVGLSREGSKEGKGCIRKKMIQTALMSAITILIPWLTFWGVILVNGF